MPGRRTLGKLSSIRRGNNSSAHVNQEFRRPLILRALRCGILGPAVQLKRKWETAALARPGLASIVPTVGASTTAPRTPYAVSMRHADSLGVSGRGNLVGDQTLAVLAHHCLAGDDQRTAGDHIVEGFSLVFESLAPGTYRLASRVSYRDLPHCALLMTVQDLILKMGASTRCGAGSAWRCARSTSA